MQHRDPQRAEKAAERIEKWSAIVYGGGAEDEFAHRVEVAVEHFETLLRPHLKTGYTVRVRDAA